jgi:hypothetical protein
MYNVPSTAVAGGGAAALVVSGDLSGLEGIKYQQSKRI